MILVNDTDRGIINWLLKFADDTKLFGKVQNQLDYDGLQQDLSLHFNGYFPGEFGLAGVY